MGNEVATPTDPMAEFKAKVLEKLREDIGAMLPDEALAGLVQKAVEQQFFEPRKVAADRWGDRTKDEPSWFVEAVTKEARPILEAVVKEYVTAHQDELEAAFGEFMAEQNLALLMVAAMQGHMADQIRDAAFAIVDRIKYGS